MGLDNRCCVQQIWDEVGESDQDWDMLLLEIERECLEVYKRKVEMTVNSRNQLLQELADAKIDLSRFLCALGENVVVGMSETTSGTIKQLLAAIAPSLERLYKQKEDRLKAFSNVQSQIEEICGEITGKLNHQAPVVDENDFSLQKLDEYQYQLQELHKEKARVLTPQRDLCNRTIIDMSYLENTELGLCVYSYFISKLSLLSHSLSYESMVTRSRFVSHGHPSF